jgi:hypothetical protein
MGAPNQIRFDVAYQFGEYLSITSEHRLISINKRRSQTGKEPFLRQPLTARIIFPVIIFFVFFYKISRLGRCRFEINQGRIRRISKLGTTNVKWPEIIEVHHLSNAYLVVKKRAPYRFRLDVLQTSNVRYLKS